MLLHRWAVAKGKAERFGGVHTLGEIEVMVGASSGDIRLRGKLEIAPPPPGGRRP